MAEPSAAFGRSTKLLSDYEQWCTERSIDPNDGDSALLFVEMVLLGAPLKNASRESLQEAVSSLSAFLALALENAEGWGTEIERRLKLSWQLHLTKPRPRGRPRKSSVNPLSRLLGVNRSEQSSMGIPLSELLGVKLPKRIRRRPGAPKKAAPMSDIDEMFDVLIAECGAGSRKEAASLIAKFLHQRDGKHAVGRQLDVTTQRLIRLDRDARKVKKSTSKIDD